MTIYLVIITTILVLTQIIRLLQNWQQLKKIGHINRESRYMMSLWRKIEQLVDRELEKSDQAIIDEAGRLPDEPRRDGE